MHRWGRLLQLEGHEGRLMSEDLTKKLPRTDSEKITLILTTVQNLEARQDNTDLRLSNLEKRFDSLDQKVEERLYDTRPIWQKAVAAIAQLQEGQTRSQEGQNRLEGEMRDIKISLRNVVRHVEILNDTMLKIQGGYRDLSHRILDIELEHQKQRNSQT